MTSQQRKTTSENLLKSKNISCDASLPPIEASFRGRTVEEIARRAMCLTLVALKAEGMEPDEVAEFRREHALDSHLTRTEKKFLVGNSTEEENAAWVWRFEALHALLWTLGYVVDLGWPDAESDATSELEFLRDLGPQGFIEGALLRSNEQILDAADWVYRLHQSVVDERLGTESMIEEVVEQWSFAFDWLTREEENWEQSGLN